MIPRSLIVAGLILACLGATARSVAAHEVRPGYLELREGTSGLYAMTWKVPALGEFRLSIVPITSAVLPLGPGNDVDRR